jgi:hypothetical protein
MNNEIKKPNDIFVAYLQKPDASVLDLMTSDILPGNTQLLPLEEYKNSPKIKEIFSTEAGVFDEDKFKQSYISAANLYTELSLNNTLAKALEYDPLDFTAPKDSKKVDVRPIISDEYNPFKTTYNKYGVNSIDESDLSLRELAQQSKIFDVKENK